VNDNFLELHGEARGEALEVECLRIDDLLPEFGNRVDFIKIDVEGAEPLVLRGAAETMAANPQLQIVMEWSPGHIRDAGFDVGGFVSELAVMGLESAHLSLKRIEPFPLSALTHLDNRPGILLRRGS